MSVDHQPRRTRSAHPSTTLRRFVGPEAREIFLHVRPDPRQDTVEAQTLSAYSALEEALAAEVGALPDVVQETVLFRDIEGDLPAFLVARHTALERLGGSGRYQPATTFIGQPPLDPRLAFEVSVQAVLPHRPVDSTFGRTVVGAAPCGCEPCSRLEARAFELGGQLHLHAGNIYGSPGSAFDEAYSAFVTAEEMLRREGMDFRNVVRTWIHLRHMERDYQGLNAARRKFFEERGIAPRPASTGIEGAPYPAEHNFSLGFYAARSPDLGVKVMTTPTLNEAWSYGSDFSRGLEVREANRTSLFISGTASIDESGRTVHEEDLEGQIERMLLNIATLLAGHGASFGQVAQAVTYLKRPGDAERARRLLRRRGLFAFPHAFVHAPVCRPDLLCEMEALALLPASTGSRRRERPAGPAGQG
jgi:enamine deaminase RidA (YjgF/YER057c/UK114 family)